MMKKIPGRVAALAAAVLVLAAAVPARAQAPDDVQAVAKASNAFAGRLYGELAKEEGNLFFSPYSISSALAMTYEGARGRTAGQMAAVLGFSLPPDRLDPALAKLMAGLNAKNKPYELYVANALWGQARYPFAPAFLGALDKYFGGGFREVDYTGEGSREKARQEINAWTEDHTAKKIRDLIKPNILTPLTRLVLTNAVYFKGNWARQFRAADTRPMPFTVSATRTVDVPMMRQKAEFGYLEDDGVKALEMRYAGDDLSMVVLLPDSPAGLGELEAALPRKLDDWLAGLSKEKVEVFLPRFKLERDFVLNEPLAALGMEDAFSEAADFSGMRSDCAKDLYITKVVHKAFVDVNEEGTEAAAATAVVVGTKSIMMNPVFKADHPFIFLVRDVRTGTVLFMGRMAEPK
ncbi:MAG: serpin family protein [Acidobacteriota bacterium]